MQSNVRCPVTDAVISLTTKKADIGHRSLDSPPKADILHIPPILPAHLIQRMGDLAEGTILNGFH